MEEDEPLRPDDMGILGPEAVLQPPGRLADLVQEPGHVRNPLAKIRMIASQTH